MSNDKAPPPLKRTGKTTNKAWQDHSVWTSPGRPGYDNLNKQFKRLAQNAKKHAEQGTQPVPIPIPKPQPAPAPVPTPAALPEVVPPSILHAAHMSIAPKEVSPSADPIETPNQAAPVESKPSHERVEPNKEEIQRGTRAKAMQQKLAPRSTNPLKHAQSEIVRIPRDTPAEVIDAIPLTDHRHGKEQHANLMPQQADDKRRVLKRISSKNRVHDGSGRRKARGKNLRAVPSNQKLRSQMQQATGQPVQGSRNASGQVVPVDSDRVPPHRKKQAIAAGPGSSSSRRKSLTKSQYNLQLIQQQPARKRQEGGRSWSLNDMKLLTSSPIDKSFSTV